jgi:hypothetical protein
MAAGALIVLAVLPGRRARAADGQAAEEARSEEHAEVG